MTAAQDIAAPSAAPPGPAGQPKAAQPMVSEWFWRFLALAMMVTVGWIVWILVQVYPDPLATDAAFEAAAKARATAQDAKGVIVSAPAPAAEAPAEPKEPKEPPVNVERLKLADSIETPFPERGKKK